MNSTQVKFVASKTAESAPEWTSAYSAMMRKGLAAKAKATPAATVERHDASAAYLSSLRGLLRVTRTMQSVQSDF